MEKLLSAEKDNLYNYIRYKVNPHRGFGNEVGVRLGSPMSHLI